MSLLTDKDALMLIKRGVLAKNTLINLNVTRCRCSCYISQMLKTKNGLLFKVTATDDTKYAYIKSSDIEMIDGQRIDSLLAAYSDTDNVVIDIKDKTDAANIKEPKLGNTMLEDGMKVILHNDVTESLNNRILNVKIDDKGVVKLVGNRGRPRKG